jgi:hypothetical protein
MVVRQNLIQLAEAEMEASQLELGHFLQYLNLVFTLFLLKEKYIATTVK